MATRNHKLSMWSVIHPNQKGRELYYVKLVVNPTRVQAQSGTGRTEHVNELPQRAIVKIYAHKIRKHGSKEMRKNPSTSHRTIPVNDGAAVKPDFSYKNQSPYQRMMEKNSFTRRPSEAPCSHHCSRIRRSQSEFVHEVLIQDVTFRNKTGKHVTNKLQNSIYLALDSGAPKEDTWKIIPETKTRCGSQPEMKPLHEAVSVEVHL